MRLRSGTGLATHLAVSALVDRMFDLLVPVDHVEFSSL